MTDFPLLSIILVNWNRPKDTLDCVESIRRSTYPNYRIIVVDNGSSDDSLLQLRKHKSNLILIEAGKNLGFTGGNNKGIQYALNLNAEYIFLLNNDTLIAPDALEKLVLAAEGDKNVGIVTPKILFYPQSTLVWAAGTAYSKGWMKPRLTGYKEIDAGQFDQERDLSWASGCALLIAKEVVAKIGLLDDEFFAVCEDLDYGLRVLQFGYRICYVPSAVIWHKESVSAGGYDAPQYVYYQTRNYILFHRRWANGFFHLILSQMRGYLFIVKRILRLIFQSKWRSVVGLLYGLRDGYSGRVGFKEYSILR